LGLAFFDPKPADHTSERTEKSGQVSANLVYGKSCVEWDLLGHHLFKSRWRLLDDCSVSINYSGYACVDGSDHRGSILDASKDAGREVHFMLFGTSEPAVVGDVQEEVNFWGWIGPGLGEKSADNVWNCILKTDQRGHAPTVLKF